MGNRLKITKERIVDAALEIAKDNGLEMVTMANIARKLQIKSPSLYNHFLSLHDINQAMAYKAQSLLVNEVNEKLKHVDTSNMLKQLALAYYQFAIDNPSYYKASVVALDSSIGLSKLPSTELTNIIIKAIEQYNLDDESLIHTIRAMRSILHGLIELANNGGFKLDINIEDTLHYTLDLFITGLENLK